MRPAESKKRARELSRAPLLDLALGLPGPLLLLVACTVSEPQVAASPQDSAAAGPRVAAPSQARPQEPRPGAAGVGDPYYPLLGNGGYDVQHYDLVLDVDPDSGRIDAVATIDAKATHDLSSFHLDLWGLEVSSVQVDGVLAQFSRDGRELIIDPQENIGNGRRFRVRVAYAGVPELAPDASVEHMGIAGVGWWRFDSGSYVISECSGAASWFPCNDHPRDKATFAFEVSVPEPWMVAANGLLVGEFQEEGRRTYRWRASDPMATYLATVNVVQLELELSEGPGGLPLRLYYPQDAGERELEGFRRTSEMIELFSERFGPYPFEAYGALIAPEEFGGALETQTLPVYSRGMGESTVAHELAHQWFGNCVSLGTWDDMWLNEGFASYAEWLWREHTSGAEALERRAQRSYRFLRARKIGSPFDPGVKELFSGRTYQRGAFVLHMLRLEIGDEAFFRLLKRWVRDHFNANASTADFVVMAEEVGGQDLEVFFQNYLYDQVIPAVEAFEGTRRTPEEEEELPAGPEDE